MNLLTAMQLVVDDVRESYPEFTDLDAIGHAVNSVSLTPAIGAAVLDDDGSELATAYRLVLEAELFLDIESDREV